MERQAYSTVKDAEGSGADPCLYAPRGNYNLDETRLGRPLEPLSLEAAGSAYRDIWKRFLTYGVGW